MNWVNVPFQLRFPAKEGAQMLHWKGFFSSWTDVMCFFNVSFSGHQKTQLMQGLVRSWTAINRLHIFDILNQKLASFKIAILVSPMKQGVTFTVAGTRVFVCEKEWCGLHLGIFSLEASFLHELIQRVFSMFLFCKKRITNSALKWLICIMNCSNVHFQVYILCQARTTSVALKRLYSFMKLVNVPFQLLFSAWEEAQIKQYNQFLMRYKPFTNSYNHIFPI